MKATDEMIEVAVAAVSENVDWVRGLFGLDYDNAQEVMRDALNAALASLPAPAQHPVATPGMVTAAANALADFDKSLAWVSEEDRAELAELLLNAALAALPQPVAVPEMIERLIDAVEGEVDGLAIDEKQAAAILEYTLDALPAAQDPQPVAYAFRLAKAVRHHDDGAKEYVNFDNDLRLSLTPPCAPEGSVKDLTALYAAAALAAAEQRGRDEERERCAKVAETLGVYPELNVFAGGPEWYRHGKDIAAAIRQEPTP